MTVQIVEPLVTGTERLTKPGAALPEKGPGMRHVGIDLRTASCASRACGHAVRLYQGQALFMHPLGACLVRCLVLTFCLLSATATAAERYVRAGATGSGSGADWTNACPGFTGTCAVALRFWPRTRSSGMANQ